VLVGIGILVEIARRLGMGFITARAELEEGKEGEEPAIGREIRRVRAPGVSLACGPLSTPEAPP
jgi:hypothetical protein